MRTAPRGVLPYYLGTEVAAVILTLFASAAASMTTVNMVDWSRAMVLVAIGIAQAELSRRTERIRRYVAETPHVNMTSVWIGAGALLLPPALAALVTVAIYGHLWLRIWRTMSTRPTYRVVFSAATMVIACLTVSPVLRACGVGSTLGTTDHDHTSFATQWLRSARRSRHSPASTVC